jgi:hypothetical protein
MPVEAGISVGCIHSIPHKDLNMHLVPEHKETQMTLAADLITMTDQDFDFL